MIRFDQVSKVFPNGYVGLQDVSFSVEPGSLTYIVGESGAGKTTLLRLLIREFMPTEGEIYFQEEPLTQLTSRNIPYLRRQIGVVFQDYKLIPERTVEENIELMLEIANIPKGERKTRIEEVLDLVDLEDKGPLFPVQLSGGEMQRIAIARALVLTPAVLYADEPTGNLDPKTSTIIGQLLKKVADLGTTVLVNTHDMNLLENFGSRELHLSQGKVIKDTAHEEKAEHRKSAKKKKAAAEKAEDEVPPSDGAESTEAKETQVEST